MNYDDKIDELSQVLRRFFAQKKHVFQEVISLCCRCLESGHKILIFGNGGSAAQAQHFSAELLNKFLKKRPPLTSIALTTDTSTLTSIANDNGYDAVFSRQVEALAIKEDIAVGLSTSGQSLNVIEGLKQAKKMGVRTIALTGKEVGRLASISDCLLDIPSIHTPQIQEAHLFLLHLMAEEIEENLS